MRTGRRAANHPWNIRRVVRSAHPGLKKAWQSCRRLGRFTADDVASTSSAAPSTVNRLLIVWWRGGYLAGSGGNWRMVRDTGPLPPRHLKAQNKLWDRNTGEVFSLEDGVSLGILKLPEGGRA